MSEFNLDRENNIDASVCANGKKWEIHFNKQTGLCHVRPNPDRENAVIPKELAGQWTKPSLLQPLITKYVIETWDKADKIKAENERKAQAAKEAEARAAKEAKESEKEDKAKAKRSSPRKNNAASTEEEA